MNQRSIASSFCGQLNRVRSSQMVGRGTRIHPGKRDLLLLDFLWLTSRHSLVKPSSLIARDENEALAIERCLRSVGGDLVEAQEAAQRDRDSALAAAVKANRDCKARRLDLIQLELALKAPGLADFEPTMRWHYEPATERQLHYLAKCGIDTSGIRGRGEACATTELLEKRRSLNLATWKQVRLMRELGHEAAHEVSFGEASAWISEKLTQQKTGGLLR